MDKLDTAILREMSQANMQLPAKVGLSPSYREMARKLKVSPATIGNRVQTL
jgi:DNA-binding Lrp family transcriptional regulator